MARNFMDGRCSRVCAPYKALWPRVSCDSRRGCPAQGSGRTDAGVHALAQVASVRLASPIPERNLVIALNDVLPPSVRVNSVESVTESFHARHSAKAKTYRYRIYRGAVCPPFLANFVYHDPYPMQEEMLMRSSEHSSASMISPRLRLLTPIAAPASKKRALTLGLPLSEPQATSVRFTLRNGCEPMTS